MDLYTQPGLREKHASALASLKMGKSCVNFQSVDELPLDTIAAILRCASHVEVKTGTMKVVGPGTKKKSSSRKH
jgi:hypothetical protein